MPFLGQLDQVPDGTHARNATGYEPEDSLCGGDYVTNGQSSSGRMCEFNNSVYNFVNFGFGVGC